MSVRPKKEKKKAARKERKKHESSSKLRAASLRQVFESRKFFLVCFFWFEERKKKGGEEDEIDQRRERERERERTAGGCRSPRNVLSATEQDGHDQRMGEPDLDAVDKAVPCALEDGEVVMVPRVVEDSL